MGNLKKKLSGVLIGLSAIVIPLTAYASSYSITYESFWILRTWVRSNRKLLIGTQQEGSSFMLPSPTFLTIDGTVGKVLNRTIIIAIAGLIYIVFLIRNIRKHKSAREMFLYTAFFVYVVSGLSVVFFPIPYQSALLAELRHEYNPPNNFVPLYDIYGMILHAHGLDLIRQIGGNILMFVPLGVFLPLFRQNIRRVVTIGFVASVGIEILQLLLDTVIGYNYRTSDIDDVILNTIGCLLGYAAFRVADPLLGISHHYAIRGETAVDTRP